MNWIFSFWIRCVTNKVNSFQYIFRSFDVNKKIRVPLYTINWALLWFHVSLFSPCSIISDISVLKLKVDKCSRQDNLFMKKVQQPSNHRSTSCFYYSDLKSVLLLGLHERMHACPKGFKCVDWYLSDFSMPSTCIDTSTCAVRNRAACSLTLRSSTHSWPSSAWSWPMKRWWWTWSVWHSLCRCALIYVYALKVPLKSNFRFCGF